MQEVGKHLSGSSIHRARLACKAFAEAFGWAVNEIYHAIKAGDTDGLIHDMARSARAFPGASVLVLVMPSFEHVKDLQRVVDRMVLSAEEIKTLKRLKRLSLRLDVSNSDLLRERDQYRARYMRRLVGAACAPAWDSCACMHCPSHGVVHGACTCPACPAARCVPRPRHWRRVPGNRACSRPSWLLLPCGPYRHFPPYPSSSRAFRAYHM